MGFGLILLHEIIVKIIKGGVFMIFKCVGKRKVPYMSQEEVLVATEISAPTLEDAKRFFMCEYAKEEYDGLFDEQPCEVCFG